MGKNIRGGVVLPEIGGGVIPILCKDKVSFRPEADTEVEMNLSFFVIFFLLHRMSELL